MAIKDLHTTPFESTTQTKLRIFDQYAEAWIPTFIMSNSPDNLHIFDFFAGPGYDTHRKMGSPLILLMNAIKYSNLLRQKDKKIVFHFNEKNKSKFKNLDKNVNEFISQNLEIKDLVEVKFYNKDFEVLFNELVDEIEKYPSLVYIDQNGIKFISENYINLISQFTRTDFLYFVASSYFKRFGKSDEFRKYMEFSKEELEETKYPKMHRLVIEKLRSSLPKDSSLMLYPFSLKKGENYYGIIFGAKHLRAVDKFLNLSWKINSINGEANFDIDDEMQLKLYESTISKIDKFKLELRNWILEKNTITNIDILKFTYLKGHIPKHAVEEVKLMKNEKLITFDGSSPKITYDNYKLNNILNITKL